MRRGIRLQQFHKSLLFLDRGPALLTSAMTLPVFQYLVRRPGRLTAMWTKHHDIRHIDGRFAFENPALNPTPCVRLVMPFRHVHTLDDHLAPNRLNFDDAALLTLILARYHDHAIVFSNVDLDVHFSNPSLSNNLGRQADDFHESLLSQLARDRAEYARADRLVIRLDDHCRILIEAYVCAVSSSRFLARSHDNRAHNLTLFDGAIRRCFFHRRGDYVAEPCA